MRTDRRYGWVRDLPDHRDRVRVAAPEALANLPVKADLRTDPHLPPVHDQKRIGSCTANGIAGAFEYDPRRQGPRVHSWTDVGPARLLRAAVRVRDRYTAGIGLLDDQEGS